MTTSWFLENRVQRKNGIRHPLNENNHTEGWRPFTRRAVMKFVAQVRNMELCVAPVAQSDLNSNSECCPWLAPLLYYAKPNITVYLRCTRSQHCWWTFQIRFVLEVVGPNKTGCPSISPKQRFFHSVRLSPSTLLMSGSQDLRVPTMGPTLSLLSQVGHAGIWEVALQPDGGLTPPCSEPKGFDNKSVIVRRHQIKLGCSSSSWCPGAKSPSSPERLPA